MQRNVLILAGGGGHTGYAYALAQALHKKVAMLFLVPQGDFLSERKLRKFGRVNFLVKPRGPKTPNHEFALRLYRAFVASFGRVSGDIDIIVSTGSNFCIPPAIVGWIKGIPIVNIESSVRFFKASITARLLQPFSKMTVLQWNEQKRILRGTVVGPLLPKPEIEPWNGGYILVTGGTYGHRLLFDALMKSKLEKVVLQTGRINPEPYVEKHPGWKVITLTENFHELVAGAELVVTHFGSTVLEATVYRKPVVLVPNPEWTRTAGFEDARCLAKKVNAVLPSEITAGKLLEAIDEARKRKIPSLPKGAENLANSIIELS